MSLSRKNKIFLWLFLGLIVIVYSLYRYAYQPHTTIENFKTEFIGTANDFLVKVQENDSIWQNKAVVLSGKITAADSRGITLNSYIYCQFRDTIALVSLQNNQTIRIKGRVIGYDDLLEELKLDQCIIQP